jgi:hypothetical protein
MKRSLVLAVSVLALAAVSKPLFAAEVETPAPSERAAPAAERTERARPARERQAARTTGGQQQASQTSSYTGTQAGGFGGGTHLSEPDGWAQQRVHTRTVQPVACNKLGRPRGRRHPMDDGSDPVDCRWSAWRSVLRPNLGHGNPKQLLSQRSVDPGSSHRRNHPEHGHPEDERFDSLQSRRCGSIGEYEHPALHHRGLDPVADPGHVHIRC